MRHKFRDLYNKLSPERQTLIEARVQGMLARLDGRPVDANPYTHSSFIGSQCQAWRLGYYDTDEEILATGNGDGR